ncbi:cupin domain-containing protein [Halegenticoccus soli]|uniref:cupin domain-containing protein n=1 Tax=Halegenticoccus soli TaxID=1985678 RepID=UPI000C6CA5BB|nr:cupin domain-containing protein [Halegenticoccus soli]
MGYRVVRTDGVEPAPDRPCELRRLSAPAGLEQMAINRFVAEPGEQLPLAYHYHDDQEEAFYVLSGTLHVETPEGTYELGPNDLFAVDPGSPQRAYNPEEADAPVDVIAVGAPPASGDVHAYEPEP